MTLKVTYNLHSSSKRQNHYSGFSSTMSSSSMINSYNGMKTKTGINGSINPKAVNEVDGHFGKGNVYENGTENKGCIKWKLLRQSLFALVTRL